MLCILYISFVITITASAADATEIKGRARVIDGDTLWLGDIKVRLNGIDAPERVQPRFRDATRPLQGFVAGKTVICRLNGEKSYVRYISTCYVASMILGLPLSLRGMHLTVQDTLGAAIESLRRTMPVGTSGKRSTVDHRPEFGPLFLHRGVAGGSMKISDKVPEKFAVYGNIVLWCLFIYSAGDLMWAAALASISAFYLGFVSGQKYKPDG